MNKIILKIVGIILIIFALSIALAYFVGVPVMRNMQYTNAVKNAENGYYEAALSELEGRNMDEYKDVKLKKQEYAIEAAKHYMENNDYEKAYLSLKYAIELNTDEKLTKKAEKLLDELSK